MKVELMKRAEVVIDQWIDWTKGKEQLNLSKIKEVMPEIEARVKSGESRSGRLKAKEWQRESVFLSKNR